MSENSAISLFQLTNKIKETLHSSFDDTYWIVAEISEMREVRNGHCYLELIEKDENTEQIIAKVRANIWAYTYRMLKPYFESTTGQSLVAGIKIMTRVSVDYQQVYGISLNIRDIDPAYTLGDMAQKKQAILNQLAEEGVIDMNKELPTPLVPQKIAIISSPTAAGYEDFMNQLNDNSFGFKFYTQLFPAIMQGENTEKSVIQALDNIYQYEDFFDVVVIIRGGGSSSDLMAFDNYWIAYNIAQFPLPVFSGIGHERDECVVDFVAHTRLKTPTAVAEHIIELTADFNNQLNLCHQQLVMSTQRLLNESQNKYNHLNSQFKPIVRNALLQEKNRLNNLSHLITSNTRRFIENHQYRTTEKQHLLSMAVKSTLKHNEQKLTELPQKLTKSVERLFNKQKVRLEKLETTQRLVDPIHILKKGYSITYANGALLTSKNQVKKGDVITTHLADGDIHAEVTD